MKRFGSVYLITNLVTGKKYVGQTIQNVAKRFAQHATDKRSGRHLYNTMNFYGKENFSIEEVITCIDQESLNFCETCFIELYNTFTPNGYNLCMGGNAKGIISEETREKMSKAKLNKTVKRTKTWSDVSRLNKSKAQGGKAIIAKNLATGQETKYDFINQAEKDGFNNSEIYRVLNGKRRHHKNHTFYYANQSGSVESKISPHAQRIGIDTALAD